MTFVKIWDVLGRNFELIFYFCLENWLSVFGLDSAPMYHPMIWVKFETKSFDV